MNYYEPDDPPYMSAGIPSAERMAAYVAEVLARLSPSALSLLAQAAVQDYELAAAGSADEATLGLLSDALHSALEGGE